MLTLTAKSPGQRVIVPAAVLLGMLSFFSAVPARAVTISSSISVNGGAGGEDRFNAVALDSSGNLVVVGFLTEAASGEDIWVAKYDIFLNLLASATFNGSNNGNDRGYGVAVDEDDNVYVSGEANETVGAENIWVGKYDSSLVFQTSMSVNGSAGRTDRAHAVIVDSDGSVLVTGRIEETAGGPNTWLARYDSDLVMQSSVSYDGAAVSSDTGKALALDSSGNVYVGGFTTLAVFQNFWLGKFDSDLVMLSSASRNPSGLEDFGNAVALDGSGNVYIAGNRTGIGPGTDIWLGKYDTSLTYQTGTTLAGAANDDGMTGIVVDGAGNVYSSGFVSEVVGGENLCLGKLDSSLSLLTLSCLNGTVGADDSGNALVLDASGNAYVVGNLDETVGGINAFVAKYQFNVSSAVTAALGAVLTHDLPGGQASITIPAGAFSSDVTIDIQGPASLDDASLANADLTATGVGLEITLTPALQPTRAVTLTFPYRDSDVAGLDENRLLIARFDVAANTWVPLFSTPNPASNSVTALTDHFSKFQIMAMTPSESVETVRVFPNPFRPDQGHTTVTLLNLPALSRIRIYTMTGQLIRDMTATRAGVASWDARNQFGALVGPGVYFGYAQSGGAKGKTFKVAIER